MRRSAGLLIAATSMFTGQALAQTSPGGSATSDGLTASPTSQVQAGQIVEAAGQGILVFEPAFFADSRPNTALDMISRLPGFGLDLGDSDTRGLAGASGNVLIGGDRPNSKSDALDTILRRIPADGVERVELIRGGAAGIDMLGRSVVANVVLKRTVTVGRALEVNNYIYPDGYVGPHLAGQFSRREGDTLLEASFTTRAYRTEDTGQGYRRRHDAAGNLIQDADLRLWDRNRNARGTIGWQGLAAGGKLKLNGLLGWLTSENEQDLLIRSGGGSGSANTEESEFTRLELGANWIREMSPQLGLELVGLQSWLTKDYLGITSSGPNGSMFGLNESSGESVARAILRYRPGGVLAAEAGVEVAYNFLDSDTNFEEDSVPVPLPSAKVKVEELRAEIFGQVSWRPSPTFALEGGLRVELSEIGQSGDSDQSEGFVYSKPRLLATWTPWTNHQFRFRFERDVGQLDFANFVASADIDVGQVEGGNPNLEPQKSTVIEAVYERRFWEGGVVDLTARRAEIEDVVDTIPLAGGFDGVGNIGDGTSDFLQLRLTLPMDRFGLLNARLQASGFWSRTEVVDPVTGEIRRFQGDQPSGCTIKYDQNLVGGRYSYGIDYGCDADRGSVFRVREARTQIFEPILTIYGQWKPSSTTTVRLDLTNLTDHAIGYDRDVYAGPRDIAPVQFTEMRRTKASPWLQLQVRKTF